MAFVMPDEWSNLAFMPWYVIWFTVPAFILFAFTSFAFHIDVISNVAANVAQVEGLWALAIAMTFAVYGFCVALMAKWFTARRRSSEVWT